MAQAPAGSDRKNRPTCGRFYRAAAQPSNLCNGIGKTLAIFLRCGLARAARHFMAEITGSEKRSLGEKRLAAIVFTDVVSFSARVQKNESLTLRLVKRDFEKITQTCNGLGG